MSTRKDYDAELGAMKATADALAALTPDAQARVLLHVALSLAPHVFDDEQIEWLVTRAKGEP
jgi:hypothetical protein